MECWMSEKALNACGIQPFSNLRKLPEVWASSWWWERMILPLTNTSIRAVLWYQGR